MADPLEKCLLCKKVFNGEDPRITVHKKGLVTLNRISSERGLSHVCDEIKERIDSNLSIYVHHDCRRRFVDNRRKSSETVKPPQKRLRSTEITFNWKCNCFLCSVNVDIRRKDRQLYCQVMTLPLRDNLIERALERNDQWGRDVLGRLESCNDLVAEEAIYHVNCMSKFRLTISQTEKKKGRPLDLEMQSNFDKVCEWLERAIDCELHSVKEIYAKMKEISGNNDIYSEKNFRRKLKERYGDHITFNEIPGQSSLVCFKNMTAYIMKEMKEKAQEKKEDIIIAAAKIIKAELRDLDVGNVLYPTTKDIQNSNQAKEWIPPSLLLLLSHLVPSELKMFSIGQCITQSSRPRSLICPMQFGLGVELDSCFGSKWLLTHLSRLGFCISPDEVLRYKQSAIVSEKNITSERDPPVCNQFVQWVADNVDHNITTLTGSGTFHGMGIIAVGHKENAREAIVKRLPLNYKASEFAKNKGMPIKTYLGRSYHGLQKLRFKPFAELYVPCTLPAEVSYNFIWQSGWFFNSRPRSVPNWSGFMQDITSGFSFQEKNEITFLPISDLKSTDETCIYSTLLFVIEQAKMLNVVTPSITFDQPLWLKATGIIADQKLDIVCRLGGFHTLMSYLGCIGEVMKGSGLKDLFEQIYPENSINHIMSGKAVSRALRAHFLTDAALKSLLLSLVKLDHSEDIDRLDVLLHGLFNGEQQPTMEQIDVFLDSEPVNRVNAALIGLRRELVQRSRTAQLWFQYMECIDIIKRFILAERTSNWTLHIQATMQMLNIFAAAGHINYAKSARLYVQQMQSLSSTHPWLHKLFMNGKHAVRRSNRYWSGLWSDLVIEQTLMRTVKSRGGLTRGRGMTEGVRHLWVLSMSCCASVHHAMTDLTGAFHITSDQHTEMGGKRRQIDFRDYLKFQTWLLDRNPFTYLDNHLHSLSSGWVSITGQDDVNCEASYEIGYKIQKSIDESAVATCTIKRKHKMLPLESLGNTIAIEQKKVYVSPTILFTRLTAIAQQQTSVSNYFSYEMTKEPMALFSDGLMRKNDKSALKRELLPDRDAISFNEHSPSEFVYVVDGGALLHRVRWGASETFGEVASIYVDYVRKYYGKAHIVFDGYSLESTKSVERTRRSRRGKACPNITVSDSHTIPSSQDAFLANNYNKEQLVEALSIHLRSSGQDVFQCPEDADTKIVATSLELAAGSTNKPIVVVADDTDIAVMLLYHWRDTFDKIIFYQEKNRLGWDIKTAAAKCHPYRSHLLFVHAWSGCDTVSATFGKGKTSFLNVLHKSDEVQRISKHLNDGTLTSQGDIGKSAARVFSKVYGGKKDDTLTKLR